MELQDKAIALMGGGLGIIALGTYLTYVYSPKLAMSTESAKHYHMENEYTKTEPDFLDSKNNIAVLGGCIAGLGIVAMGLGGLVYRTERRRYRR